MTAAYRLKGAGWLFTAVAIALGFYLVSLRVAQERKKLEAVNAQIATAHRDIRALETEFDTRANLVQLEKWNGDTLALAAPTAGQFVHSEAQLAAIDVASAGPQVRTAALVVPSIIDPAQPATTQPSTPLPALAVRAVVSPAPVRVAVATARPAVAARVAVVKIAAGHAAPGRTLADLAADTPMPGLASHSPGARPRAVAMLDAKLLSDATLGDLLAKARREAKSAR